MTQTWPTGLQKYSETALFTEETVPKRLLGDHDTKPGVWGKIVVTSGALTYIVCGPPEECFDLSVGVPGLIEPQAKHRVELSGPVAFRVEFYKQDEASGEG